MVTVWGYSSSVLWAVLIDYHLHSNSMPAHIGLGDVHSGVTWFLLSTIHCIPQDWFWLCKNLMFWVWLQTHVTLWCNNGSLNTQLSLDTQTQSCCGCSWLDFSGVSHLMLRLMHVHGGSALLMPTFPPVASSPQLLQLHFLSRIIDLWTQWLKLLEKVLQCWCWAKETELGRRWRRSGEWGRGYSSRFWGRFTVVIKGCVSRVYWQLWS